MPEPTEKDYEAARVVCGWFAASFGVRHEEDDLHGAARLFAAAREEGRRQGLEEAADGCKRIAVQLNEQASSYRGAPFPAGQVESLSIFGNRVALDCERAIRALIPQEPVPTTELTCDHGVSIHEACNEGACWGTVYPREPAAPCETCGGELEIRVPDGPGRWKDAPCPKCGGDGSLSPGQAHESKCPTCGGTGWHPNMRRTCPTCASQEKPRP